MRPIHRTAALLLALLVTACGLIQVKGNIKTSTTINGVTEEHEVKFDKLEDLPAALNEAGGHLGRSTAALKKALIDAPPPGVVHLRDLSPGLAAYEGKPGLDFLQAAREEWAKAPPPDAAEPFTYVQIGTPTFDQFFKQAAEFHGLTFQVRQAVGQSRKVALALLESPPDAETSLVALVSKALQVPRGGTNDALAARLPELQGLLIQSARLAPLVVSRAQGLIGAGQQLVAGAAASITNPKTLLHIDLVKQGMTDSISVIAESATLLGDMVSALAGFSA